MNRTRTRHFLIVISLILTLCFLPFTCLVAWTPPANVTINKAADAAYFKRADGSDLQAGFYYIAGTNEIAYCVDADATGPGGNTYSLSDSAITNSGYLYGIQSVLQYGYPYKMNGLSADDARYATQAAIHWLENYYLGGSNGWNYTLMDTVNANGHDAALAWAKSLFNIGVNQTVIHPKVLLDPPTGWVNGQCTVFADETDTAYWEVTAIPAGVSLVGGTTQFTGDVTLIFQLNDPVAYAASDKKIVAQGYVSNDVSNIHIFTTSGGYQTMAAVSQSMSARTDPSSATLYDATGGFALHKVTQTLSGDIPEANATFQIFSSKYASFADTPDAEKGTITTNANGDGNQSGLPYGTYYLDQISAPTGVTLIPRQMVTVGATSINNPVTYLNTLGYGHIDLTKRMNQAGTPYEPGATFRIYLKSAGSYDASPADQRDQITTDANGHAVTKDLPYGEYCMIQTSAAPGMKIDTTVREYRIGMDASGNPLINQTIYENIVNDLAYGRIEIHKTTDLTVDVPEEGAEFQIFPIKYASYTDAVADGAATAVITTDATGYAISPYLPFDRYVVVQSKAPAGTIPGFGFFVWIGAVDQAVEHVDLVNQTYWGTIRVQKYTVSPSDPAHIQTPESGATFQVYPSSFASYADALANDPKSVDTCDVFTTGANGLGQTTHQLPYGTYTVEQIDNAATANTTKVDPWQVTIGAVQNGVYSYVRENPLYEQFLRIIKTDADTGEAIPIAGAAFEILDASNNVISDRFGNSVFYTDTTGTVDLSSLPLLTGTYGIRETVAPTGYAPSPVILYFSVDKSDHGTSLVTVEAGKDVRTVSIENKKIVGVLEIYKIAADTQLPMPGVVFEVYDKDGKLMDTLTTDAEGKAKTKILPYGVYTLIETKTLTGYILSDKSTFSIFQTPRDGEAYSTVEMTIANQKVAGILEIYKIAADTQLPMPGVVFEVYDKDGKLMDTLTTDAEGKAKTKILPYGVYTLIETKTLTGYILSDKSTFSIFQTPRDGEAYSTVEMTIANQKMGKVEVYKVTGDGTSTPMNGVVFGVYNSKTDAEIARITTDTKGYGYVFLMSGDYYLKEISTWEGYAIVTDKIPVKGITNGMIYTFRESNSFTTTRVYKTNTSGTGLAGMLFSITDATGKPVSMYYDSSLSAYVALVTDKVKAPSDASIVTQGVTGTDGTTQVLGLLAGQSYIFSETAAPSGYLNDSKPVTLTIGTDVLSVARFVDSQITVTVKTGESSSPLLFEMGIGLAGLAVVAAVVLIYKKKHA